MALSGRPELHHGGHPGLRISMKVRPGGANLRRAEFSLPRLLSFDSSSLKEICARREAIDGNCPPGSRIGSGRARTPLLRESLKGGVYLVQPRGSGAPDIWTSLGGSGLQVELRGETVVEDGRVVARLVDMPDFPLTSFAMRLVGGKHGVFELTESPCAGRGLVAPMSIEGQNGALRGTRARVAVPGGCERDG
jgi:hypothetical protein